MKFSSYLLIFLTLPLLAFSAHKYYISLCEIEYVQEKKSIQISLGLFIDDLEFTLNKTHDTVFYLSSKEELNTIDTFYENYLNDHFQITINNDKKAIDYIGKEYDDDIVRFYLEIGDIESLKSLEVQHTSLLRDFPDQQNIIKIKVNKFHKTFYLDKRNDKGLLNF